jgi:hypothetical protein
LLNGDDGGVRPALPYIFHRGVYDGGAHGDASCGGSCGESCGALCAHGDDDVFS